MIKEINQLDHLNRALRQWICPENEAHYRHLSSYDPAHPIDLHSTENMIRSFFISSARMQGVMPYIKIWSYEKNNFSKAACAFLARKNEITNQSFFEEIFWQFNGKLASTIGEKKILIKLLKTAESHAKSAGLHGMLVSRSFNLHSFSDKQNQVNNFYTKNQYKPLLAQYYKKLQ